MAGKIAQIWDAIAACFQASDQPLTMAQILAWIGNSYPNADFHPATVKTQVYGSCANVPSAYVYRKDTPKILFFEKSNRTYRLFDSSEPEAGINSSLPPSESGLEFDDHENVEAGKGSTFAMEAHLRDYLAINLHELEPGLILWDLNPPSVEYSIGGKRIDILAKDTQGVPVVIELKLDRGYDKVVGQGLLYQALVSKQLKLPKVRVILVANEISYELKMACSRQLDVELFEYAITMQIAKVGATTIEEED
jgi:endonuclease